ncbi:hypothetical protein [Priestia megaterium]|uniref:hypothetical protein n=1 Tax=Priestia megaterium TaxID=1404 RepID=UPI00221F2071|nr:hypothetical protein [Priestia megaterium]UYV55313.1 hypothetical protein OHU65_12265 [Priestia megaterium]
MKNSRKIAAGAAVLTVAFSLMGCTSKESITKNTKQEEAQKEIKKLRPSVNRSSAFLVYTNIYIFFRLTKMKCPAIAKARANAIFFTANGIILGYNCISIENDITLYTGMSPVVQYLTAIYVNKINSGITMFRDNTIRKNPK